MNILDFILIIPLVWCGYKGFRNGFIKELFSVIALILGIYATYKLSGLVAKHFDFPSAPIIAFVLVFLTTLIAVHFVGNVTEKIIKVVIPEILNKILGIGFGAAKVVLICSILLHFVKSIDKKEIILKSETTTQSLLYKYIDKSTDFIIKFAESKDETESENAKEPSL